jgi:hypothetical protein
VSTITGSTFIPYGPASARLEERDEVPELAEIRDGRGSEQRAEPVVYTSTTDLVSK